MIEWLGISHLFELSPTEAIAGFFTPLAIFAVFLLAQVILPGRRVPGYVINPETGEPSNYRLNGILVFAIALIVRGFELTGMPVAGSTGPQSMLWQAGGLLRNLYGHSGVQSAAGQH